MFRNLFGGRRASADAAATISVPELKQRLDAGDNLYLLDVRSAEEYTHEGHIAGAHLLPLPVLAHRLDELPKDIPIVCICRSGNRSGVASEQLRRMGFGEVLNLTGGMLSWARNSLPIKRG